MSDKKYRPTLVNLMNHLNSPVPPYTKETTFTEERLLQIRPQHVLGYLTEKAYSTLTPSEDALPQFARKSSLEYCKKAISLYAKQALPLESGDPVWQPNSVSNLPGVLQEGWQV